MSPSPAESAADARPAAATKPLVLLIEDEPPLRRFLRISLAAHGYRLIEAETGELGLQLASQHVPDIVLLDLGLPDLEGIEVVRRLRAWSTLPILILSARGEEAPKVAALDAGADDYLTKPFGLDELLARLRVALRHAARAASAPANVFESGPLRLDLGRRRVFVQDVEVRLTPIEYRLLTTLVQHAGRVVTHKQLLEAVWGPHSSRQTHYLRVYMTHLRRKVEPDPLRPQLFQTEAGVGYRLQVDSDAD
jgi:two-component system KDP operon response regulator KdpE